MVFVLDRRKSPLMPCTEKRAWKLLGAGRARVHRLRPFTIRIVDRHVSSCKLQPVQIKLDPGSKTTGIALVRQSQQSEASITVLNLFELAHRGRQISEALTARRSLRRRRRSANLRYRAPRFNNRTRPKGWLAPSLQHRVNTTRAWVNRLQRLAPVTSIAQELVRFDLQKIENPEIQGVEYQQGALLGYEIREYLLEKFNRRCAYCDAKNVPLQIDHVTPKAEGGSNRISNLTLACRSCNEAKGAQTIQEFLARDPVRLKRIQAWLKTPLKDAAAVNATRWALFNALKGTELPVEIASGGRTKWNRKRFGMPKTHAFDAVCVGVVDTVTHWNLPVLTIKATGRGLYKRTLLTAFGFPRGYLMRTKSVHGFRTGDTVRAVVPKGKKAGTHTGRVVVRTSGSFDIKTLGALVGGVGFRHCRILMRGDGYSYALRNRMLITEQGGASSPS